MFSENIETMDSGKSKHHYVRRHTRLSYIMELGILLSLVAYFLSRFMPTAYVRHAITFVGFVLICCSVVSKAIKISYSHIDYACLIIISSIVICNMFLANNLDFDLIYRSVSFLILLIIFTIAGSHTIIEIPSRVIYIISMLITLIALTLSYSNVAYLGEQGKTYNYLTLGMTNPNLTAMILAGCLAMMITVIPHLGIKAPCIVSVAILLSLIWRTGARSSFVSSLMLIAYSLAFAKRRVPRWIQYVSVALPVLIVPLYIWASSPYGQVVFLGKYLFTGRESIYIAALDGLKSVKQILVGDLASYRFGNAHNSFLMILVNTGSIGAIICESLMLKRVLLLGKGQQTMCARLGLLSLLMLFVQSSAESNFFTGGFPSVVFMYFFVLMANDSVVMSHGSGSGTSTESQLDVSPISKDII